MTDERKPSATLRIQLAMVRLLGWANGLEGWLSITAGAWGMAVLIWPQWWNSVWVQDWPLTPKHLAMLLVTTSITGLLSLRKGWRVLRMQSSVLAFMSWGLLMVYDLLVPTIPVCQAAALHGMLAIGELGVYVRVLVGMDQRRFMGK